MASAEPFTYDGGRVDPGETASLRYTVTETYLGDPVRMPVTIVNGAEPGPTVFLTAASHGDELNGIEVVREVAHDWDHSDLRGTLVCCPVLNVPGFIAQQRYLPIYDRDLNRSFPGNRTGNSASRIAHRIFENFVAPCDYGLDFHTSTRGRTNLLHVRADMDHEAVAEIAQAFGSNVIIAGQASSGALRHEATAAGVPTITVEMGEAHRFQREFIDEALRGVESVAADLGMRPTKQVRWPGWRTIIDGSEDKTWIRAHTGGMVDMYYDRGDLVYEGEPICAIADPFKADTEEVPAPFDGLLVGVAENPLVYPGNPLCHFAKLDADTVRAYERNREDAQSATSER